MPTTADPNGKHGVEPQESDAYRVVVHWAPLVVPLFALLIAVLVALIERGVLAPGS